MKYFLLFLTIFEVRGRIDRCNGSNANQCYHHTSFTSGDILSKNCEKYRKWASWIHLPNIFGDLTIADVENRVQNLSVELATNQVSDTFR